METKNIQITAGKGPLECAWVVAKVLKIFLKELESNKIAYKILQKENGLENGTVQSVCISIKGNELQVVLKNWLGTIQWIGTSSFRKNYKRKNWFIACYELKKLEQKTISKNEIQFQAIRSSGAGGQHVNKVSSAIRAKHLPTGVQVLVMDSRSQHQNRKIAMKRLEEKIADYNENVLKDTLKGQWENHLQIERGNPIRIFEGSDFKQNNKDHSFKKQRNQLKKDLKKEIKDYGNRNE